MIAALDARHVWHPYTQHGGAPEPLPIARACGAYLYDANGRPILDAISSWWVTLHGHAEPSIADAIARQARELEQVIFAGFTHAPGAELAGRLVERLPRGLSRVFYSDDGSTAVEVALKMALQYWRNRSSPRDLVVALEHAYHGDTFGAMSASSRGAFSSPFADKLFDVERLPSPDEGDTLAAFDDLLERRGESIAALIVEPLLLGAGGMRVWQADTLADLAGRARDNGILLVADEVLTGFGRTGPLFACEHSTVSADIVCLSKGLTGGFLPLGATVTTEEVFAAFTGDAARTLFHGHSYTGNPLACAAALASLQLLDEACAKKRTAIEGEHDRHLSRLSSHPRVRSPRLLGTVAAFNLEAAHSLEAADSTERGYFATVGRRLGSFALERGVLLRPLGDVVYVLPPYCITADELERVYAVIEEFLEDAA